MRSNKILFLFLGFFLVFICSFAIFIRSSFVTTWLTQKVSSALKQEYGIEFVVSDLRLNLFPSGLDLRGVQVLIPNAWEGGKVTLSADRVGITLNTFDVLAKKISVREISASSVKLEINGALSTLYEQLPSPIEFSDLSKLLSPSLYAKLFPQPHRPFSGIDYRGLRFFLEETAPVIIRGVSIKDLQANIDGYPIVITEMKTAFFGGTLEVKIGIKDFVGEKFPGLNTNLSLIDLSLEFSEKDLAIDKLHLEQSDSSLSFQGEIAQTHLPLDSWRVKLRIKSEGDLKGFVSMTPLKDNLLVTRGAQKIEADLAGPIQDPDFVMDASLLNFEFKYLIGDRAEFHLEKRKGRIILEKFVLRHEQGVAKLSAPAQVYDFNSKKLFPGDIQIWVENLHSNTFLHFIQKQMEMLRARFTGDAKIQYRNELVEVLIPEKMKVEGLTVISQARFQEGKDPLVSIEDFNFSNAFFNYHLSKGRLDLGLLAQAKHFSTSVSGYLDKLSISIKTDAFEADLEKMGTYGGQVIKGEGPIELKVEGPLNHAIMFLTAKDMQGVSYLGYSFDFASLDMTIDFSNGAIDFKKINGRTGKSDAVLSGTFRPENLLLNLEGEFKESYYTDIVNVLGPLTSDLTYLPEEAGGTINARFKIYGSARPGELVVDGQASSASLNVYGEDFHAVKINFLFKNKVFDLKRFSFMKGEGHVYGRFSYDGNDSSTKYRINARDLLLSDFQNYKKLPLGLGGILSLDYTGGTRKGVNSGKGKARITESTIANLRVADSFLNFDISDGLASYYAELFKGGIILHGRLDFSEPKGSIEKRSNLDLFIGSDDLNLLTGLFFEHNAKTKKIRGRINSELKAEFNWNDWSQIDANLLINDLHFARKNVEGRLVHSRNKIRIKNGKIREWDLAIKGNKFQFASNGEGDFSRTFSIKNYLDFDGSLLEIFSKDIQGAGGQVSNQLVFKRDINGSNVFAEFYSNNFTLAHSALPGSLDNLNFKISMNNNHFLIETFRGQFANGKIRASGDFLIKSPHPEFNISFSVENSYLNFFKRSTFLVTGEGVFAGTKPPYDLSGNFILGRAQILDELNEFGGGSKKTSVTNKFIPQSEVEKGPELINFNISVDGLSDIQVKNSIGEMKLRGNLKILGTNNQLRLGGQLNLVPGTGKFFFKTNDFLLTKGNILFFPSEEEIVPEINFAAKSRISEYDVELKIYGRVNKYALELSSEPALSQEDIFSLLTVGFTEDVSQSIGDKDRQSLTSVGIGSVIFDRFKIGQELSSSLGVKLSVAPELVEANSSMLTSKGGDAAGPASRLRSTTKIKLQKNITDALDISVSSSVGGSVGQRQEMNLNYSLNKNVSVLGVYEVRTDDDTEDSLNTSSIGGDLKFKWTFK